MTKQGWTAIHRKLQDHWLWKDKPFSKGQAWIDLLLLANHDDKKILFGNALVEVKCGSFITSELTLMERWGWGKSKTRSFLDLLQKDGMIVKMSDHKKTTINIVNYSVYANFETTGRPQADREQTTGRPQAATNNNYNNYNNYNNKEKIYKKESRHKYGMYQNVLLSDTDVEKLKTEFPNDWEWRIERLSEYIASTGKAYKNHLATIRSWARKENNKKVGANGINISAEKSDLEGVF